MQQSFWGKVLNALGLPSSTRLILTQPVILSGCIGSETESPQPSSVPKFGTSMDCISRCFASAEWRRKEEMNHVLQLRSAISSSSAAAFSDEAAMTSFEAQLFSRETQPLLIKLSPLCVDGARISIVGPEGAQRPASFQVTAYEAGLRSCVIGRTLLVAAELPSTQTLLHQNFAQSPDGTLCVADTQSSGRGRGKNTWTSPHGCLMFSLYKILAISGTRLPFVQYIVCLAIVSAVQDVARMRIGDGQPLDVKIKWPNDIYAKGMKIGGILCQSIFREGTFHLIVGAGLNVTNREPTTCIAALLSEARGMKKTSGQDGDPNLREVILAEIASRVEVMLDDLCRNGFDKFRGEYLRNWLHTDQQIILEERQEGRVAKIPLTITGISENAYLTAKDAHGGVHELHPDGNSFDFFQGLVRQKPA